MASLMGIDEFDPQGAALCGLAAADSLTKDYFDILLLGKTGKGKSTTGNKLLGISDPSTFKRATEVRKKPFTSLITIADRKRSDSGLLIDSAIPCRSEESALASFRQSVNVAERIKAWPSSQYKDIRLVDAMSLETGMRDELERTQRELNISFFSQGEDDDPSSKTRECKLLSNEKTKIRVLDCPGFADSETAKVFQLSLYGANLQTIRWIVRNQKDHGLVFNRILYFLPERGPLTKADRVVQEEIKVMVHYFGETIFYNMVLVATLDPDHVREQGLQFMTTDIAKTTRAFSKAMRDVLQEVNLHSNVQCPPVLYISVEDSTREVLNKVKAIEVRGKAPSETADPSTTNQTSIQEAQPEPMERIPLLPVSSQNLGAADQTLERIEPQATSRVADPEPRIHERPTVQTGPSTRPQSPIQRAAAQSTRGKPVQLAIREDVCAKCSLRFTVVNGEKTEVIDANNTTRPYRESMCHPAIYPKYSQTTKILGGIAHLATLGLGLLIGDLILRRGSWPGFTNSDETCPACVGPPGREGCAPVLQNCDIRLKNGQTIQKRVDHGNKLD